MTVLLVPGTVVLVSYNALEPSSIRASSVFESRRQRILSRLYSPYIDQGLRVFVLVLVQVAADEKPICDLHPTSNGSFRRIQ